MRRPRRAAVLLTCLALHVAAFPVRAQTPPTIAELQIALWPEYDNPSMLVIYRIHLDPATELPAVAELPIPASAGDPLAVAMTDSSGALVNAEYTRRVSGEWGLIGVTAESLQLQIEYYSPLAYEGQLRRFSYVWPGASNVMNMAYEVQAPIGAQDMTITPAPESQTVGQDGLTYYSGGLGADAGISGTEIDVTYVKPSPDLTANLLSLPPGSPASTQGGSPDLRQFIPWALLAFGVVLVGVGGVWYLRLTRATPATGRRRRRPSHPTSRSDWDRDEIDASPVFCHQCGTPAAAGDRFCRRCGVRLRR